MGNKIFIKLVKFSLWIFLFLLASYFFWKGEFFRELPENFEIEERFKQQFQGLKTTLEEIGKPLNELKKWGEIFQGKVKDPPKDGLKIAIGMEEKEELLTIVKENEIYLTSKGQDDWVKFYLDEEILEKIFDLKKNLEKKEIFKNVEREGRKINFEVDEEELMNSLNEWIGYQEKKEKISKSFNLWRGEIFLDENGNIKNLSLEKEGMKLWLEIKNFQPKKGKNLESFLVSLFESFK